MRLAVVEADLDGTVFSVVDDTTPGIAVAVLVDAEAFVVPGNDLVEDDLAGILPQFETHTVAAVGTGWNVEFVALPAVLEHPGIFNEHRAGSVPEIEAVIRIVPRAAAAEDIAWT